MPIVCLLRGTAVTQASQGVLPDGFQQPEPRLVPAGLRLDQAAVYQRVQDVDHQSGRLRLAGSASIAVDRLGGGQAERAGKDAEAGE